MPEIHVDSRQVAESVGQAIENALYSVMRRATRFDDLLIALNNKFREQNVQFALDDRHHIFYVYVHGRRAEFDDEIDAVIAAMNEYIRLRDSAKSDE